MADKNLFSKSFAKFILQTAKESSLDLEKMDAMYGEADRILTKKGLDGIEVFSNPFAIMIKTVLRLTEASQHQLNNNLYLPDINGGEIYEPATDTAVNIYLKKGGALGTNLLIDVNGKKKGVSQIIHYSTDHLTKQIEWCRESRIEFEIDDKKFKELDGFIEKLEDYIGKQLSGRSITGEVDKKKLP